MYSINPYGRKRVFFLFSLGLAYPFLLQDSSSSLAPLFYGISCLVCSYLDWGMEGRTPVATINAVQYQDLVIPTLGRTWCCLHQRFKVPPDRNTWILGFEAEWGITVFSPIVKQLASLLMSANNAKTFSKGARMKTVQLYIHTYIHM
ncbi:hypothetical protein F4825DRAFT_403568 [Nemania diffusa]|nr:hypothetical protein F4825DRAFT_403568 [Nemania diffusa]